MKRDNRKLVRIAKIIMLSLGILTAAAIVVHWYFVELLP